MVTSTAARLRSFAYFNVLGPMARAIGFSRAGNLYQMAAYYLHKHQVLGVVDGGAFDGQHAIYLSKLFRQATVYAFEPAPATFEQLTENIRACHRIVPVQMALAEHDGVAELRVNTFAPTNSLLASATTTEAEEIFAGRGETVSTVNVETVSLVNFAERQPGFAAHVIKLDLQGYELPALRGAREVLLRETLAVVAEVRVTSLYEGDCSFEDLDRYLASAGFRLACIGEVSHHPDHNTMFEANGLWLKKTVA